jgi:hypothetical protein
VQRVSARWNYQARTATCPAAELLVWRRYFLRSWSSRDGFSVGEVREVLPAEWSQLQASSRGGVFFRPLLVGERQVHGIPPNGVNEIRRAQAPGELVAHPRLPHSLGRSVFAATGDEWLRRGVRVGRPPPWPVHEPPLDRLREADFVSGLTRHLQDVCSIFVKRGRRDIRT